MAKVDPTLKAIRDAARSKPPPRHSAVYKWMKDRYPQIKALLDQERPEWETVRSKLSDAGLRNIKGQVLTVDSVRQTWAVVCRHVQASQGTQPEPKSARKPPNRSPRGNTAPIAATASPSRQVAAPARTDSPFAPNQTTLARPANGRPSPEEAREILRRQLDPRGRHLPPRSTT